MRKIFLLAVAFGLATYLHAGTIDINGTTYPSDTLAHYQVGPGTYYTRFNVQIGSTQHRLYMLDMDLTNPFVKIEEYQSQDRMGATERMDAAHPKIDSVGHRPIGSVNCNFWVVASQAVGTSEGLLGQPFAGSAKDGMLIGQPDSWNNGHGDRGYVMIDEMNRALIRNLEYKGRVCKGSSSASIRDVNRNRVTPNANEIALFNRYCGAATRAIADTVVEVVFDALDGWQINDTMPCVVLSRNTTGGTALTGNQGALQARGARGDWCRTHLAVGDTFQIYLGMFATSLTPDDDFSGDSIAPHVMQMVTGNCLVMANGVLTSRNTNEGYNNQNYPRTMLATNNEGTHFWMLVSEKPGNYTGEMCGILKNDGATWAAGMDGGGSAQMNLFGSILNPTTEATPRAVANSLFVVNTAPDCDTVSRIDWATNEATVSSFAAYTPAFRVYNRYGTLLTGDVAYTLTCEPASLGTISEDGQHFTAGAISQTGTLTMHVGDVSASQTVRVEAGELSLRWDSIVVDCRPYELQVLSSLEGKQSPIPASAFTWTSSDEAVATVEDGVVHAVANGRAVLQGTLGETTLTKVVLVQIPAAEYQPIANFDSVGLVDCKLEASSGFNPTISKADIPNAYTLRFDYSVVRGAYLHYLPNIPMYGLPDSLFVDVQTDAQISKVTLVAAASDGKKKLISLKDVPESGHYIFSLSSLLSEPSDRGAYPFSFNGLEFMLDSKTSVGSHTLTFSVPTLVYPCWEAPSALVEAPSCATSVQKRLENGTLVIVRDGIRYSVLGQRQ